MSGSTVTASPGGNTGNATITVTASDPSGLTATQTYTVYIEPGFADAIPGLSSDEQLLLGRLLTYDTIIFNELHNGSDDANDWLELRNVSNVDIPLDNWQLSIQSDERYSCHPIPGGYCYSSRSSFLTHKHREPPWPPLSSRNPWVYSCRILCAATNRFRLDPTEPDSLRGHRWQLLPKCKKNAQRRHPH